MPVDEDPQDGSPHDREELNEQTAPLEETTDSISPMEIEPSDLDETVFSTPSILESPQIDRTIDPRSLRPEEVESWNQATIGSQTPDLSAMPIDSGEPDKTTLFDPSAKTKSQATVRRSLLNPTSEHENEKTLADRRIEDLRVCEITRDQKDRQTSSRQDDPQEKSEDYRIIDKLGQGGMGDVFRAEQLSLGRLLALKVMRPLEAGRRRKLEKTGRLEEVVSERRLQFLNEARVTGDLDHPNIVPVHDVALTDEGELFYSMKQVIGTPWSETLIKDSLHRNLEILLRVCDAIAFAHTRGVVHRDIKPENIMLGDFGVVLVMDWGLALPTSEYPEDLRKSILSTTGLGGTPAFMAPEMATGPIDKIGPASDIYLLGATLYLIVAGYPPHQAPSVTACLKRVRENVIRQPHPECQGELLDIALKAMETQPQDRYATVLDFQNAIQQYQLHAGSIDQTREAFLLLEDAKQNESYEIFSKAAFKFEDAIESWQQNNEALQGLAETKRQHAEAALANTDFDLAKSLIDSDVPELDSLRQQIDHGIAARDSRESRLRLLRWATAAMLLFIVVGSLASLMVINEKRAEALAATQKATQAAGDERKARMLAEKSQRLAENSQRLAEEERQEAKHQRALAVEQQKKAMDAKQIALKEKQLAEDANRKAQLARESAEEAKRQESYEAYLSKINLAKARLEDNDVAGARKLLLPLRETVRAEGWEFRWLWRQVQDDHQTIDLDNRIIDASFSSDGKIAVVLTAKGVVKRIERSELKSIEKTIDLKAFKRSGKPMAVAISPDHHTIAIASDDGQLIILSGKKHRLIEAHHGAINDVEINGDWVVTASEDRSVIRWNVKTGTPSKPAWHLAPVHRIAVQERASQSNESFLVAAIEKSENSGRITVWETLPMDSKNSWKQRGRFTGHRRSISAVAITKDGGMIASGDIEGNLLIWKTNQLHPMDYEQAIERAMTQLESQRKSSDSKIDRDRSSRHGRLIDPALSRSKTLVAISKSNHSSSERAHTDAIESLHFSKRSDFLVSGARDFSMKTWNLHKIRHPNDSPVEVFRGHAGAVLQSRFMEDDESQGLGVQLVSASSDGRLRVWDMRRNVKDAIKLNIEKGTTESASKNANHLNRTAHSLEITSATFSPDGSRVLTSSADHSAKILMLNPDTQTFTHAISLADKELDEGTPYVAMSVQSDRAGKYLFVGSTDATVRLWDRQRGVQLARISGTGLNQTLAISPEGTWLLTGASEESEQVILWEVLPASENHSTLRVKRHRSFRGHDQVITALAVSNDGKQVFTGDSGGYGILWDATTGKRIGSSVGICRGFRINRASFANDGKSLWLAADDDQLTQVDLVTRKPLRRLAHNGTVKNFSFSQNESCVMTLSQRRTRNELLIEASIWNIENRQKTTLKKWVSKEGSSSKKRNVKIGAIGLTQDGRAAMAIIGQSASADVLFVWRRSDSTRSDGGAWSLKPIHRMQLPKQIGETSGLQCQQPDRCSTLNGNGVYQWDLESGKLIKSYRAHSILTHADFSTDGRYVFTSSRGVKIWNATTGNAIAKIDQPHHGPTWCITAISSQPDSVRFVTGGEDGWGKLWDYSPSRQRVKMIRRWSHPKKLPLRCAVIDPTGKWLLLGGDGATALVVRLDGKEGRVMTLLPANGDETSETPSRNYLCGAFSEDAKVVALGSDDKRIALWEIGSDNDKDSRTPLVEFRDHSDSVLDLKLHGSIETGLRGFSVSADDTVRIWDPRIQVTQGRVQASHPIARQWMSLKKHSRDVTAVDFSQDREWMMTADKGGNVFLWPAPEIDNH